MNFVNIMMVINADYLVISTVNTGFCKYHLDMVVHLAFFKKMTLQ